MASEAKKSVAVDKRVHHEVYAYRGPYKGKVGQFVSGSKIMGNVKGSWGYEAHVNLTDWWDM